ncbi:MAG: helix-turn-helix transcriptional regulator [Clostridia bacterium]|nr:helix-turn-helix transcriptional regulator [Clostridia bacterium]
MNIFKEVEPTEFFEIRKTVQGGPSMSRDSHYHPVYEIYYLTEGSCWQFIDKKSYRLTPGDIACIPAGVIHKTSYDTRLHSRILISCDASYIPSSVKELLDKNHCFPHSPLTDRAVKDIISALEQEYSSPDGFSCDMLRCRLAELLILIARSRDTAETPISESPIVERAAEYIRKNYVTGVSLSEAAAYCYVSREHLSRTFKKETGFGFNEYLTVYRLKKAEMLLKSDTSRRIGEIAAACGFSDSNYFSKVFKRVYKMSPGKARKAVE